MFSKEHPTGWRYSKNEAIRRKVTPARKLLKPGTRGLQTCPLFVKWSNLPGCYQKFMALQWLVSFWFAFDFRPKRGPPSGENSSGCGWRPLGFHTPSFRAPEAMEESADELAEGEDGGRESNAAKGGPNVEMFVAGDFSLGMYGVDWMSPRSRVKGTRTQESVFETPGIQAVGMQVTTVLPPGKRTVKMQATWTCPCGHHLHYPTTCSSSDPSCCAHQHRYPS